MSEGSRKTSLYESLFDVPSGEQRSRGRPAGTGPDRFVFPMAGLDRDLAKQARQRAVAVVMAENQERLRDLYEREYKALAGDGGP